MYPKVTNLCFSTTHIVNLLLHLCGNRTFYLELLHLVLQLRLFLHHVPPLRVQPRLHLSSHLFHLAQHLHPTVDI